MFRILNVNVKSNNFNLNGYVETFSISYEAFFSFYNVANSKSAKIFANIADFKNIFVRTALRFLPDLLQNQFCLNHKRRIFMKN